MTDISYRGHSTNERKETSSLTGLLKVLFATVNEEKDPTRVGDDFLVLGLTSLECRRDILVLTRMSWCSWTGTVHSDCELPSMTLPNGIDWCPKLDEIGTSLKRLTLIFGYSDEPNSVIDKTESFFLLLFVACVVVRIVILISQLESNAGKSHFDSLRYAQEER